MNRLGSLIRRTRGVLVLRVLGAFSGLLAATVAQAAALTWTDNQPYEFIIGDGTSAATSQSVGVADAVAIDAAHKKFYVTDRQNHRVLRFAYPATSDKPVAEAVFGQSDFTSGTANRGYATPSAYSMSTPYGLAVAANGDLWVSDNTNNRILKFASAHSATGDTAASRVLGQAAFNSNTEACANNRLTNPSGLAIDASDNLWVADSGNNRVLRFASVSSAANGAAATQVLGQPNFDSKTYSEGITTPNRLHGPYAVCAVGTVLWVADSQNHRVVRFNNATTKALYASADGVLGQADLNSGNANRGGNVAANTLSCPGGLAADDSGTLIVSDSFNNRVLIFANAATLTNGAAPTNRINDLNTAWNIAYDSTYHRLLVGLAGGYAVRQYSNGYPTSIALTSSANPSFPSTSVTFTATVTTSGGATPTGSIQFTENNSVLGTGTLNASGVATFATSTLTTGNHYIVAKYPGDATHQASGSPGLNQSIERTTPTVTLSSSANPAKQGTGVTFTVVVAPAQAGLTTPTGSVDFNVDGAVRTTTTLDATGKTTWTVSDLSLGVHSIVATYNGSTSYFAASTTFTAIIDPVHGQGVLATANIEHNTKGTENDVVSGSDYGGTLYTGVCDGFTMWTASRFNVSAVPATFVKAELKVHISYKSDDTGTYALELHGSNDDVWSDTADPRTAPTTIIATPLASRAANTFTSGDWLTFDVTNFVRDQVGGDKTASFVFTMPSATASEWYIGIDSRENSSYQPVLQILEKYTYASWAETNFSPAELANSAIGGATADPDGSGFTNLLRYALGLAARGPVVSPIATTVSGTTATVAFPLPANRLGVSYVVQSSPDLATWTDVQTYTSTDTVQNISRAVPLPPGATRYFLRLKVVGTP